MADFQPDLWHYHPPSKHRLEHRKVFLCESWEEKRKKLLVRELLNDPTWYYIGVEGGDRRWLSGAPGLKTEIEESSDTEMNVWSLQPERCFIECCSLTFVILCIACFGESAVVR